MSYKQQSEAEILKRLEAEGVGTDPAKAYINSITVFAEQITDLFKEGIQENVRSKSGSLAQSVIAIPGRDGFEIQADLYYKFVDEGVSGAPGANVPRKITNAPNSFKHIYPSKGMIDSLRTRIPGSMARMYQIAYTIKKRGIEPHNLTDKIISEELLEMISEDFAKITGVVMDFVWEGTIGKQSK